PREDGEGQVEERRPELGNDGGIAELELRPGERVRVRRVGQPVRERIDRVAAGEREQDENLDADPGRHREQDRREAEAQSPTGPGIERRAISRHAADLGLSASSRTSPLTRPRATAPAAASTVTPIRCVRIASGSTVSRGTPANDPSVTAPSSYVAR